MIKKRFAGSGMCLSGLMLESNINCGKNLAVTSRITCNDLSISASAKIGSTLSLQSHIYGARYKNNKWFPVYGEKYSDTVIISQKNKDLCDKIKKLKLQIELLNKSQ